MTTARLPIEIRNALKQLEPKVRKAFLKAIGDIRKAASPSVIAKLIEAGDIEGAVKAMRFEASLFGPLDRALEEAYRDGGITVIANLPIIRDPLYGGSFALGFNGRHPRAEKWALVNSSALITEVVADQVRMARETIQAGVEAGKGPASTALDIVGRINKTTGRREGGYIGITSGQAKWVRSAEAELLAGDYAAYQKRNLRNRTLDKTIARAVKAGRSLTRAEIDKAMQAYRNNILRYRGEVISRTETITALRAGRSEGYRQLIDTGAIRDDQITRRWRATGDERTRATHMAMNDLTLRGMNTPWQVGASLMMYPGDVSLGAAVGDVAQCRCYEEFTIAY